MSIFGGRHNNEQALLEELNNGIRLMQKSGVDRVILNTQEAELSPDAGGWVDIGRKAYYPVEMLTSPELEMIDGKKTYAVFALVAGDCGGLLKDYTKPILEQTVRNRPHTMFLDRGVRSNMNYVSDVTLVEIADFAKSLAEDGIKTEDVNKMICRGVSDYNEKTMELMEKEGVYESLQKLEGYKPIVPMTSLNENFANSVVRLPF